MENPGPSRTAWSTARHRAAHQLLEAGRILSDPESVPLVGQSATELEEFATRHPHQQAMRWFICARARFSDDQLALARSDGTGQLVVLGAGLDTAAWRAATDSSPLRIFEVDHPATQAWKRERIAAAGLKTPDDVRFVPLDLEAGDLIAALVAAGFDPAAPSFFSWLGVVPYLTGEAITTTFRAVGTLPARIVFDFGDPPNERREVDRRVHLARSAALAKMGEPWKTTFTPQQVSELLAQCGLRLVTDLGPRELSRIYYGRDLGPDYRPGAHVALAAASTLL